MATLEEIFQRLKERVKDGECRRASNGLCYADTILKIPGLRNITLKVSASSDGRYFMSIYRGPKIAKQLVIYADDAEDFEILAAFLKKHADTINKYTSKKSTGTNNVEEVDEVKNENHNEKQVEKQSEEESKERKERENTTKKKGKVKKINVEEVF